MAVYAVRELVFVFDAGWLQWEFEAVQELVVGIAFDFFWLSYWSNGSPCIGSFGPELQLHVGESVEGGSV